MRGVDQLIKEVRRETDNVEFSATEGLSDEEFVRFLDEAQTRAQSVISAVNPSLFVTETEFNTVSKQEEYLISDRLFLQNRIVSVEISLTSSPSDYFELPPRTLKERISTESSNPAYYIRRSGRILLNPIPTSSSSSIRVNYERSLDNLDKRRGVVDSVVGSPITAINLSLAPAIGSDPVPGSEFDDLLNGAFISFVDKNGVVQARGVPVTSAVSSTGVITIPSHTLPAGQSISPGDYCVFGEYATTHSGLPDMCERYLLSYAKWRTLKRDEHEGVNDANRELAAVETDMVSAFADVDKDVIPIPVLDPFIL